MHNVLLVDDDEEIQQVNKNMLKWRGGYNVSLAANLAQAREALIVSEPDIIILEVELPDGNGLDFLKELRQEKNIPVLILTGLRRTMDLVAGFEAGGDDYLSKPYKNDELLARIEALLRRSLSVPEIIKKGKLKLETYSNEAFINEVNLRLTGREFDVLFLLTLNEGKVLRTDNIYKKIWKQPLLGDKNAVQTIISRLRKKIKPSGYDIEAVRGKGYVFTKT